MNPFQFVKQLSGKFSYVPVNSSDAASVAFIKQMQKDLKKMNVLQVPFSELKVVVFDLETTGFFPKNGDWILSIGAVKMQGDKILETETFYSQVYSEKELSVEITNLTGITNDQLKQAPPIEKVLTDFYQYIRNDSLVAHHANHEKVFMEHMTWSVLKTKFLHRVIDTSFLTRIVTPELQLITLEECCSHYGIEIDMGARHHALSDAMITAKLWSENLRQVQKMGFSNLSDVYSHLGTLK